MELKQIKKIIYQKDFDIMAALREHLLELEEKRNHMEADPNSGTDDTFNERRI